MFQKLHKTFYQIISKLDEHSKEVVKKSIPSMAVKVSGMFIGLAVSVALGRLLGAEGFGIINLAARIVAIIIVLGLLGIPQVIIKEVSIAKNQEKWSHIGNVMFTSYVLCGTVTIAVSVLFILIAPWVSINIFEDERLTIPLIVALMVMTPQVFSMLFSSALVGYKKIWQSNLVDQTLSVAIVGLLLTILYFSGVEITINLVAILYAIGRISVTVSIGLFWRKIYYHKYKRKFIGNKILKTSMPLLMVSASYLISSSIDTVMIGWLSNVGQVGLFAIGLKIALLTSFIMQISNSVLTPKIAEMYHSGRKGEMQLMIQQVTKWLSILGIIVLLIVVLFGRSILRLWGEEFADAYYILVVLSVGQFINILTGPVGNLLAMTNQENILKNIMIITLIVNILLNFILINYYDALGAAIATAITIFLSMLLCTVYVKIKLGFIPILASKSNLKKLEE